ncbi:MAG: glycosyltransferase [Gemmatimonadota bacterium]
MRILYVVHQFYPEFGSGTERFTLNLARAMQRAGHAVHVLTWRLEGPSCGAPDGGPCRLDEVRYAGVPVTAFHYVVPPPDLHHSLEPRAPLTELALDLLDRHRFDVAHVTHAMRTSSALDALVRRSVPYVVTVTDFFLPCYRIDLVRVDGSPCEGPRAGAECQRHCLVAGLSREYLWARARRAEDLLHSAAAVVAPSRFVASVFQEEYPDLEVRVVPHGVDQAEIVPRAPREADGRLVVGYLGSLLPHKGVDVLIRAFRQVEESNLRLELYGEAWGDSAFGEALHGLADGDPRIRFRGGVPAAGVADALAEMDVIVLPSVVRETFSLVLSEALAAGVPAVVSRVGALAERVVDGTTGRHVTPRSIEDLARVLREIAADPAVLRRWRSLLQPPARVEDEAFAYEGIYRGAAARARGERAAEVRA